MSILLLGCGKMGGALLKRWTDAALGDFLVVDPVQPDLPKDVRFAEKPDAVPDQSCDILIIAIKPQMFDAVLPAYANKLKARSMIYSIAAGCSAERIAGFFPGVGIIRAMPNLPALVGRGITGLFAGPHVLEHHREAATKLGAAPGRALWLESEDMIDRLTAVAGSGPGYIFELARAYVAAAEGLGFQPCDARTLVLETIIGSMQMALESGDPLTDLRDAVTSKGGTTAAGLSALTRDGLLEQLLEETVHAAYDRAVELR